MMSLRNSITSVSNFRTNTCARLSQLGETVQAIYKVVVVHILPLLYEVLAIDKDLI